MKHAIRIVLCCALFAGCLEDEKNPLAGLVEDVGLVPSPDQLHGTWYVAEDQLATAAETLDGLEGVKAIETTFRANNTFTLSITMLGVTVSQEGTWSLEGSTLTRVVDEDRGEFTIVILDDTLTMTDAGGAVIIYSRLSLIHI